MIFTCLVLCLIVLCLTIPAVSTASRPIKKYTIVIDAGHGGIDGGSVGVVTKSEEAELNLEYVKCLKDYFENFDINVVLTRTNSDGLYGMFANNKKKDDMVARKSIIERCNADVVISVHMNSFPLKSSRGCQCFYSEENEASKSLANSVQEQLKVDMDNAKSTAKAGDYYIIKCTNVPGILVECGFLSNPDEDKLISTTEYRTKICYSIFCGVIKYFGAENL